jgi:hypothetical protein
MTANCPRTPTSQYACQSFASPFQQRRINLSFFSPAMNFLVRSKPLFWRQVELARWLRKQAP